MSLLRPKTFLTARWRNLILANYAVPAPLLEPYLPPGIVLDEWQGRHWASLVAFQFLETKVFGITWPGYRNFPEWNLRFYVRQGDRRGVCFVREFVPSRWVAWMARTIYNEPYQATAIDMNVNRSADMLTADYTITTESRSHRLKVEAETESAFPEPDSEADWFKEHSWGFGRTRKGDRLEYQVSHPRWQIHKVIAYEIDVGWSQLYGPAWAEFDAKQPESVYLASGSAVSVAPWRSN